MQSVSKRIQAYPSSHRLSLFLAHAVFHCSAQFPAACTACVTHQMEQARSCRIGLGAEGRDNGTDRQAAVRHRAQADWRLSKAATRTLRRTGEWRGTACQDQNLSSRDLEKAMWLCISIV